MHLQLTFIASYLPSYILYIAHFTFPNLAYLQLHIISIYIIGILMMRVRVGERVRVRVGLVREPVEAEYRLVLSGSVVKNEWPLRYRVIRSRERVCFNIDSDLDGIEFQCACNVCAFYIGDDFLMAKPCFRWCHFLHCLVRLVIQCDTAARHKL